MSKKRKALKLLRFKAFLGAPSGIRTPDTLLKIKFLHRFAQHYAAFDALLHLFGNIYTHKVA